MAMLRSGHGILHRNGRATTAGTSAATTSIRCQSPRACRGDAFECFEVGAQSCRSTLSQSIRSAAVSTREWLDERALLESRDGAVQGAGSEMDTCDTVDVERDRVPMLG